MHCGFGFVIDGGGCFVENEDGCIFEYGACQGDALALSAGEFLSSFANECFVAVGKIEYELVCFCELCGFDDLSVGDFTVECVRDIFSNGSVEQEYILTDESDRASEIGEIEIADVEIVYVN